jgi:hypothetical protein
MGFFGSMSCYLVFILIYYLNSFFLERDTKDVDEVFIVFKRPC